jgi:hypothetical protein
MSFAGQWMRAFCFVVTFLPYRHLARQKDLGLSSTIFGRAHAESGLTSHRITEITGHS